MSTQHIARVYLRVSTDDQDLQRQEAITAQAKAAGYYVAGTYREKASGARADRPELLRMVGAHQPDRRLPLAQQRQDRRWQVQTATAAANGLACFVFRSLRRPLHVAT